MAKVIPFPESRKQAGKIVDQIIAERMPHKPPEILRCLKIEMTDLIRKYFSDQEMTLSLVLPNDLTEEQFRIIEHGIQETIGDHNKRMSQRSNQLFFDLCMSRMMICELRYELQQQN
ncbi:hypothetical protein SAMN02745165_02258 [Malonomonas rubra DSM 5091]|uniref:Uncharacterized protein n=1 Tax=Malonomonas rubra DSM 5091 TaxID=1122189 RepID=A0A1M6IVB5_MALRU|nr:hypothetical protein [Malonomonas rubra]SHJ38380.1 hypothetical protein SAMN02745165_02258 [Malonomonas rubra DSM 5091]